MSIVDYRKLPEDRLSTTDEFGDHVTIIPAEVHGKWKIRRTWVHIALLIVLLVLPWIDINGQQALLLNIPDREFNFFGLYFFAHDAPKIFFVLTAIVLALAVATALWGRVWCGWACPQTVFIETIFRGIEKVLIGNRIEQLRFNKAPWTLKKAIKFTAKWIGFLIVSLILSHTLVAYFVGRENLIEMMSLPPAQSWLVFVIMAFVTAVVLFDFGWFREQFCIIMCPYGRFQAVLMDKNSKTVTYDHLRGEPRHKGKTKTSDQGDCIDCYKCVSVCPTGIDIRKGQQLECIACTRCIDACDEVMEKVDRPKGLIRYASLNQLHGKPQKTINVRVVAYLVGILLMISGLAYALGSRDDVAFNVMRTKKNPYQVAASGKMLNEFKVHIKNQVNQTRKVEARLATGQKNIELVFPLQKVEIPAKGSQVAPFFIQFSSNPAKQSQFADIEFINSSTGEIIKTRRVKIVRPKDVGF